MSENESKQRKPTRRDISDEMIRQLRQKVPLDGWDSLVEEIDLPGDFALALVTGRAELVKAVEPRPLTAEECGKILHALGVLIETNMALQAHANQVAVLVESWSQAFTGLESIGRQIQAFANFRTTDEAEEES